MIRFTPRKRRSVWSKRNIDQVEQLIAAGRMKPAGLAAYAHKDVHPNSGYSAQTSDPEFTEAMLARFKVNAAAWAFHEAQPPSYRRQTRGWIMSAKREQTRERRFNALIEDSANGLRLKQFRRR